MYDIVKPVPTLYGSVVFRSKLEAHWAAFFDICQWSWKYEPVDLGCWIPDFSLGERKVLVEVKPFKYCEEWSQQIGKIRRAEVQGEVVLLGEGPRSISMGKEFAWLLDKSEVWDLDFGWTQGNNKFGLCPMMGPWVNYIWSVPEEVTDHPNKWSRVYDETEAPWPFGGLTISNMWRLAKSNVEKDGIDDMRNLVASGKL